MIRTGRDRPVRTRQTIIGEETMTGDASDHTVDPDELVRYRRMAELWWQPDGPLWPLHVLNELRRDWIRDRLCEALNHNRYASRPLEGLSVLDIGCGGGLLSEAMARMGARVHGVDVVERNIAVARQHALRSGLAIDYECTTAEALAERGRTFDVVLNMEVVEHVADLGAFMDAVNALVKPGGHTFVSTLNRNPVSYVVGIIGAEYLFRILPRGTHQWRRFVRPDELGAHLARGGLEIRSRTGVKVNPLNRRMWLSPSMSVNYMVFAERSRGVRP
jgi:2-polyprenyl-6-hydroxyphenyl methylase/3-demethylubiquinone-9 3-methyltransferase